MSTQAPLELKKTVNLPKTGFAQKANLGQSEPARLKKWAEMGLYQLIRRSREGRERFILHDGPPYANADIHLGTAMNKILKDIVVKSRTMMGYDSPYVPGYDCHGRARARRGALERAYARRREARGRARPRPHRRPRRRACTPLGPHAPRPVPLAHRLRSFKETRTGNRGESDRRETLKKVMRR